ncbi:phosphonate ABC transporter ATP-binding protein [Gemella sp. GH3]|uniref:phosphonate ABC transporter ATP-binding protein n=1 Tax=unclassified Gemella TaxID=2624949 RepID=UPI0015CFA0B3|nr:MULTISPECIES: phosphonate ABC transporter ATP-binding protein [unclassified Gemella]MBF0713922.1 phosphonate ABC transporter ATP-binding protein [Gemella sp. GH3.1]NYS50874.1 phosphonate ABC transporter ATP-binding protein [Gemella sp. GH3]
MTNYNLIVKNLTMSYNDKDVLDDISFQIEKGDFVAVLGKSGAGKSTLLKCINKLLISRKGEILINGNDILKEKGKTLQNTRKKISFIFQDYNILDNLYTIDNVLTPFLANKNFFSSLLNNYTKEEYSLAIKYLGKVGLIDEAYRKSKYLSGGQKQRVAIAKAICQKPEILLADEPVSNLDQKNTEDIMNLFATLNKKKNITILMNLHDVDLAKKYSKKILGIKNGKILFYKKTECVTDEELIQLYN